MSICTESNRVEVRRLLRAVLLVLSCSIALSASAGPPSFLCTQAKTWIEQTICSDDALADLDLILAADYARLLAIISPEEVKKVIAERSAWWASRNGCRQSNAPVACLSALYDERISALRARADFPADAPRPRVDVTESNVKEGASGWAKGLSDYIKAINACLPLMPVELDAVTYAWLEQEGKEVVVRMLATNEQTWVCVARRDGGRVVTLREKFEDEKLPEPGPYFYVGANAPKGKCGAVKVLDPSDNVVGWLANRHCAD